MTVVLVYDVSNRSSYDRLQHWLTELETYSTKSDVVKMLVANKIDRVSESLPRSIFSSFEFYLS